MSDTQTLEGAVALLREARKHIHINSDWSPHIGDEIGAFLALPSASPADATGEGHDWLTGEHAWFGSIFDDSQTVLVERCTGCECLRYKGKVYVGAMNVLAEVLTSAPAPSSDALRAMLTTREQPVGFTPGLVLVQHAFAGVDVVKLHEKGGDCAICAALAAEEAQS